MVLHEVALRVHLGAPDEALRVVNTDEISLEMTAPNRPGLLKAGPDFQYVIMPVNLQ